MIARVRGVVARDRQADDVSYVDDTGVGEYRQAQGCRYSMILTRDFDPDISESDTQNVHSAPRVEVIAFSIWDGEAAIQAFAGPDINAMVLYPEDQDFLVEPPTLVHHQVDFTVSAVHTRRAEESDKMMEAAALRQLVVALAGAASPTTGSGRYLHAWSSSMSVLSRPGPAPGPIFAEGDATPAVNPTFGTGCPDTFAA